MKTSKKTKPNGKTETKPRQAKKAVGHENRVSALRGGRRGGKRDAAVSENVVPAVPIPTAVRTQANRIRGRKPAYDGTPNYTPEKENPPTSPFIADSPIQVDDDLAGAQLRELAELQTDLLRAQRVADEKKDAAATAKKTVDSKANLLLEKLRMFTHPPSLPLFDQKVESRAVTQMKQGEMIDAPPADEGPTKDDDEETQPAPEAGSPEPEPAPAA